MTHQDFAVIFTPSGRMASFDITCRDLRVFFSLYPRINFLNMLQTLEMLQKKENLLVKKANLEVEKAKNFTKAKNKRGTLYKAQQIH
jgi:hypothetical protein